MFKKIISIAIIILIAGVFFIYYISKSPEENKNIPVRIGYFQGGRVNMIYRAHINGYFDAEGVNVRLYTKDLKGDEILEVPKSHEEFEKLSVGKLNFGKMSGIEIVDKMIAGEFEGGTIGESSFVASIAKGLPIVAVAILGYDAVPGKAIIMRGGIKINSPEDFKGKTLISRRAGPGDGVFLREFIEYIGLDPEKDVKIIDQVDEDDANKWLKEGNIDGGLYHLLTVKKLVDSGDAYVYRQMDWMDSKLSHAVLVFHADFLNNHREEVQKVVDAYIKRIKYEKNVPLNERDESWDKGLMMEGEFEDMNIPAYDLPPTVRIDLLDKIQDLLLKYGEIDKRVDMEKYIDYSFVENAMLNIDKNY